MTERAHLLSYAAVAGTIFFTVYGQLVVKWQVSNMTPLLDSGRPIQYIIGLILNPWIISSICGAFVAFLCWTVALSKLELSHAYPFMASSFVAVLVLSAFIFNETVTIHKVLGIVLIVGGLIIGSRG